MFFNPLLMKSANRKILKESAKHCTWPECTEATKEIDPEFVVGSKRKRTERDDGMDLFLKMVVKLNKSSPPCQGFKQLIENLSTCTNTMGVFQVVDVPLMNDLKKYLKGDSTYNFVKGTKNIALLQKLTTKYPAFVDIIQKLAGDQGMLQRPIKYLY